MSTAAANPGPWPLARPLASGLWLTTAGIAGILAVTWDPVGWAFTIIGVTMAAVCQFIPGKQPDWRYCPRCGRHTLAWIDDEQTWWCCVCNYGLLDSAHTTRKGG